MLIFNWHYFKSPVLLSSMWSCLLNEQLITHIMQSWKTNWKQGGLALAMTKWMMNKVQFYPFHILTTYSPKFSFHIFSHLSQIPKWAHSEVSPTKITYNIKSPPITSICSSHLNLQHCDGRSTLFPQWHLKGLFTL